MKKISIIMVLVLVFTLALVVAPVSANEECCGCCECPECPGVGTPGYWKNHPEAWPVEVIDPLLDESDNLVFTKEEALEALDMPVRNDKSITMFKAWVAAYLNLENGCVCEEGLEVISNGYWWLVEYPLGSGVRASSEAWQFSHGEQIYLTLDAFNNGYLCFPERE
jgi:hypothetical protein